jgi:hypothetical protein
MLTKLCLKSVCNIASIGSFVREKINDHFLSIFDPKRILNGLQAAKWENNYGINRMLETSLTYLIFRRVYTLEISFREM